MAGRRRWALTGSAAIVTGLAACGGAPPVAEAEEPIPFVARCTVVSRPSVFDDHNHRDRLTLGDDMEEGHGEPGSVADIERVDSGRFVFRASFSDGEYMGREIGFDVFSKSRPKKALVHTYMGLSRSESPINNHGRGPDGHGFTGLVYVGDPFSRAQLQYYCWHMDE
jgi:hypothetical protein